MQTFLRYTKCPPQYIQELSCASGAQRASGVRLTDPQVYGLLSTKPTPPLYPQQCHNIAEISERASKVRFLPFSPTEIIDTLRFERYVDGLNDGIGYMADSASVFRRIYYGVRPLLPVPIRRVLQRLALRNWTDISFPTWPLDTTVDDFIRLLWVYVLESSGEPEIPFIWYWPKGFQSTVMMTHDVETAAGREHCRAMLLLEQEYGIRSAFEIVPEGRYEVSSDFLDTIRGAGGEVCVHGLNHDGRLFSSEQEFRRRAEIINQYAKAWGAKGFRSPVMYRNQKWYDALQFSYDMSVPNVAHLDPQRGGCCTVFPYFIGDILQLPLTTAQDYSLYNILKCDPLSFWAWQLDRIASRHGLGSFIIHPDYTIHHKKQALYRDLLKVIRQYADQRNTWLALPGEVDRWWRERDDLTLTKQMGVWTLQGRGADRAGIAFARLENGKLMFVLPNHDNEKGARILCNPD